MIQASRVSMHHVKSIMIHRLGLSNSENNTIMIVNIVVFTIVNTITIVGYQFFYTLIINKKGVNLSSIAHGLEYRLCFIYFTKLLSVQLISIP